MGDISANGDSEIANGFKRRVSLGAYEQGAADEIKAYMTGDRLQDTKSRASQKILGGIAGGATAGAGLVAGSTGLVASIAFLFGKNGAKLGKCLGTKGVLIGGIAGAIIGAIAGGITANSSPDKKNMEKVSNY